MSKLEQLIEELCPDGVEYSTLNSIGTIIRGSGLQKKDFIKEGVGCIHYGQIYTFYGAFAHETIAYVSPELAKKLKKVNTGDLVIAVTSENLEDVCKCVAWLGEDEIVTGGHSAIFKHKQNPKFLSYVFQTEAFFKQKRKIATGTKVVEVYPSKLGTVLIPVPPLEVQQEIVRILDNFTELTANLTTELTARKSQYEYYKNKLLTFYSSDKNIQWMTLNDATVSLRTGLNPRKFFKLNTKNANNYYVTIRELQSNRVVLTNKTDRLNDEAIKLCNNRSNLEIGDVLFSGTGTIGETAIIDEKPINWNIKEGVYTIKPNYSIIKSRYLMYLLQSKAIRTVFFAKAAGGTVRSVPMGEMLKLMLPIPSLKEQERIVAILDRFDSLCNDISIGLPAEIEARRKQYEYYRETLLTFKELET